MKRIFVTLVAVAGLAAAAFAQSPGGTSSYSAAVRVNDQVVTYHEIDQRVVLLRAFDTAGDLRKVATDQLIDERLRLQAAGAAGIAITDAEIEAGVDEFAQRGGLNGDELYIYILEQGATPEALQDFVRASLAWRTLVQARFGPVSAVTEAEIDAELNLQSGRDAQEILISEIRIPVQPDNEAAARELAERLSREIRGEAAFGAAARQYSNAPSRDRSGRLDWMPVTSLPPVLAGQVMALQPGEVTVPLGEQVELAIHDAPGLQPGEVTVPLGETLGLFQFHSLRPAPSQVAGPVVLTYVSVNVPRSARAESKAIELINDVDTCLDLRIRSRRFNGNPSFSDHVEESVNLPGVVAAVLARLDPNEASYYMNPAGGATVVMLCSRLPVLSEDTREIIRNDLFQQRIGGFSQAYLQDLKGDAEIIYPE
ncbi:MAG: peptidylprolyl isomerase [Rhodobacteraceae bacterium]|nr:peptidylprolyl isomerase [Paracoccaceae bacterium]